MKHKIAAIALALLLATGAGCPKGQKHKPAQSAESFAMIQLKVIPPDAAVIVDGKIIGNAWDIQLLKLSSGPHTVEIRKEGYQPYKVKIDTASTAFMEVELKKRESGK